MRVIVFITCAGVGYLTGAMGLNRSRLSQTGTAQFEYVKSPTLNNTPQAVPKPKNNDPLFLETPNDDHENQLEKRARDVAADAIGRRGQEYKNLFSNLGVDAQTASQLIHHISKIYQAKAEAANDMYELQSVKQDYDQRMELLTGSRYAEYRAYEARYLPTVETENLKSAAAAIDLKVPGSELTAITDLIQENEAFTFNSFADMGTPYGEVMPPMIGKEFAPGLQKHVTRLGVQVQRIVDQAKNRGLSEASIRAIKNYYGAEFDRYLQWIEQYGQRPKS